MIAYVECYVTVNLVSHGKLKVFNSGLWQIRLDEKPVLHLLAVIKFKFYVLLKTFFIIFIHILNYYLGIIFSSIKFLCFLSAAIGKHFCLMLTLSSLTPSFELVWNRTVTLLI